MIWLLSDATTLGLFSITLVGADERDSTSRMCQTVMMDGSGGWNALIAGDEAAGGSRLGLSLVALVVFETENMARSTQKNTAGRLTTQVSTAGVVVATSGREQRSSPTAPSQLHPSP